MGRRRASSPVDLKVDPEKLPEVRTAVSPAVSEEPAPAVPLASDSSAYRVLREAAEAALNTVPFVPPVDHPYADAVMRDIRARMPSVTGEVFHRIRELVINVSCDGARYYRAIALV